MHINILHTVEGCKILQDQTQVGYPYFKPDAQRSNWNKNLVESYNVLQARCGTKKYLAEIRKVKYGISHII